MVKNRSEYMNDYRFELQRMKDMTDHSRLLPKKILKGPSELNAENLGAQHTVHV